MVKSKSPASRLTSLTLSAANKAINKKSANLQQASGKKSKQVVTPVRIRKTDCNDVENCFSKFDLDLSSLSDEDIPKSFQESSSPPTTELEHIQQVMNLWKEIDEYREQQKNIVLEDEEITTLFKGKKMFNR